jgi:hypothetical protein
LLGELFEFPARYAGRLRMRVRVRLRLRLRIRGGFYPDITDG